MCRLAWVFALLGMFATACVSTTTSGGEPSADSAPKEALDADELAPSDELPSGASRSITVDRVSDGDSVRATSAEGDLEIRLLGLNAPEGDECFGDEAQARLEALLDRGEVTLSPWPAEIDDFGRELGFLVADGVFVNLSLIESGHAVARDQSDHGFAEAFENAEEAASSQRLGLWAADACGEDSGARFEFTEIQADAPGNDQENPNGEWVVFENVGDSTADLSGWQLRDESTRHRYDFPDISVEPGQRVRVRTGCGDEERGGDVIELFWCSPEPPIWNNGGDTAFLLDSNGSIADYLDSSPTR
jgi:micrococcal nuclease